MKTELIQNRVISIPQTTNITNYKTLIKADDCFNYLTGIAAFSNTAPVADYFQIEFRDDFKTILSFSPAENWIKNPTSQSFNLQDVFKPLNVDAKGRNFWFNVKVGNCQAFDFVALLRQNIEPFDCKRYDEQSFDIVSPALGQGFEFTLPSDYNTCKGIMLSGGDTTNQNFIGFEIYDSAGSIVDPIPFGILKPTINTPYDCGFYPVNFPSKSRQIRVRLTALGTLPGVYSAANYTVTFLLV